MRNRLPSPERHPLALDTTPPRPTMQDRVLEAVRNRHERLRDIARVTQLTPSQVYTTLGGLKKRGLLVRTGQRGWHAGRWSLPGESLATGGAE
jgi:predicted Rossmann fold nucleotide-binding protein DprA/Smf involved in DNA uptake